MKKKTRFNDDTNNHRPDDDPPPPISPAEALGVNDAVTLFDAYYDSSKKEYVTKNAGGRWQSHTDAGIKRQLKSKGFRGTLTKDEKDAGILLTPVEGEMNRIVNEWDVFFCGTLAGRKDGFYDENGVRFLVTDPPKLLVPVAGDWPVIRVMVETLVAGLDETERATQLPILLGWLASAMQSLYSEQHRPGQALALAGPVGCGKSVFQNLLVTPLLGGRSAKCAPFLQGRTTFNGELFGSEHLMLEDESTDTNIKSRMALAGAIKQICVNVVQPCHGKHKQIVNLCPFWRLTISLNDEPERLLVIPPLDPDIADKIIILRCSPVAWPLPINSPSGWTELVRRIREELPHFLHYLLAYQVPAHLHSDRYGIIAWQHPELSRAISDLAPEARMAELIVLWLGHRTSWTGTADQLSALLCNHCTIERQAREILRWSGACSTYLGKLVRHPRPPLQVEAQRSNSLRQWNITLISDNS